MKRCVIGILFLLMNQSVSPQQETTSSEKEDIRIAEQAILASLAVESSPKGRYLCSEKPMSCVGPSQGELGLAIVGARRSRASLKALAELVRFALDGAMSEAHTCYLLNAGKQVDTYLARIQPERLRESCLMDLGNFTRQNKDLFEGLSQDHVCSTNEKIRNRIKAIRDGIRRGQRCDDGG